ncbi:MAG: DNA recombination/repair protein RecA [Alphaproteobacteria bacterium]|nr:DNA recombination/repair protein RecA [Alphaproteobacteria bacterium]
MDLLSQLREVVGDSDPSEPIPYWLKTSLPNVNLALSGDVNRGFPGGRLITISGPESCGKTALATECMVQGQRAGGFSFAIDYEHAFEHHHAESLGLSTGDNWFYKKPATAEEGFALALKIIETLRAAELGVTLPASSAKNPSASAQKLRELLRGRDLSKMIPIVGLMDSIASMIPQAQDIEYEKQNMKTKNMELAAMLSIELKRLARDASMTGSTFILLNQLRTNPGVMFGDSTTEPGGWSPRYYASQQIRLRRVSKWYETYDDPKSEIIGDVVELYTQKNKVHRPFKKTRYVFRTVDPVGLDLVGTMIYLGKNGGILGPVSGTTVEFDGKKRWSIKDFDAECRADADLRQRLVNHVMGTLNPVENGPVAEPEDDEEKSAFAL